MRFLTPSQDGQVLKTSPDDIDLAPNLDVPIVATGEMTSGNSSIRVTRALWGQRDGIKHRTWEWVVTSFPIHLSKSLHRSELAHFNFVQEQKLLWYDIPSQRTSTEECPWRFDGAPCTYAHDNKWLRWSLADSRRDRKKSFDQLKELVWTVTKNVLDAPIVQKAVAGTLDHGIMSMLKYALARCSTTRTTRQAVP